MGAMDEWANDAPKKHNPIHHGLIAVGALLLLPIVEWWDDRGRLERAAAIGKAVIVLACAAAVVFLGGCRGTGVEQGTVDKLNNTLAVTR
jgi:hypothetical protein